MRRTKLQVREKTARQLERDTPFPGEVVRCALATTLRIRLKDYLREQSLPGEGVPYKCEKHSEIYHKGCTN